MASPASTGQRYDVLVFDDYAAQIARRFVAECRATVGRQGVAHVGLTGGQTARQVYEALARREMRSGLDVRAIQFYQGDERAVAPVSAHSNWGMAEAAFLNEAGVPAENRHRMVGEAGDLDEAARQYEALLRSRLPSRGALPCFDLLLLGMGEDGHVASLFPGTGAVDERERLVVANFVPPMQTMRMTITYPMINAARAVWVIVTGQNKSETVRRAIEDRDAALPVCHVAPADVPVVWMLDRAAASKLRPGSYDQTAS